MNTDRTMGQTLENHLKVIVQQNGVQYWHNRHETQVQNTKCENTDKMNNVM